MNEQETVADIIAEMNRVEVCADGEPCLRDYARRFDAAHKREVQNALDAGGFVEASRKNKQVGNAAKLREALKLCMDEMCNRCRDLAKARGNPAPCLNGCEPVRKAKAALAAPPRNCDAGTAEEQAKRLNEWCNGRHCTFCRFKGGRPDECKLKWAQMPYKEGGAK